MSRPQQRAPKGRDRDRADRRAVIDVLLARLARDIPPSAAETALLTEHVREEQRQADENRKAMAGTTQALARHREAADAAIVEAEQRAAQAETELTRSENAREHLRRRYGEAAQRAEQAEAAVTQARGLMDRRTTTLQKYLAAAEERAEQAEERLARIRDMADAWETRLPATIRTVTAVTAVRQAANGDDRPVMFSVTPARIAEQHRRNLAAILAKPTGTPFAELTEYAAKTITRAGERILDAEHRATRYRTAWMAARRDRKADRAAMAAELPYVEAGRRALSPTVEAAPVTLATPCANPDCEHPRNWHTQHLGCVERGGACPCPGFEPPTTRP